MTCSIPSHIFPLLAGWKEAGGCLFTNGAQPVGWDPLQDLKHPFHTGGLRPLERTDKCLHYRYEVATNDFMAGVPTTRGTV